MGSTLAIARQRQAERSRPVVLHDGSLAVFCSVHESIVDRYGNGETCVHCGAETRPATPGTVELDMAYANGEIDGDSYDTRYANLLLPIGREHEIVWTSFQDGLDVFSFLLCEVLQWCYEEWNGLYIGCDGVGAPDCAADNASFLTAMGEMMSYDKGTGLHPEWYATPKLFGNHWTI